MRSALARWFLPGRRWRALLTCTIEKRAGGSNARYRVAALAARSARQRGYRVAALATRSARQRGREPFPGQGHHTIGPANRHPMPGSDAERETLAERRLRPLRVRRELGELCRPDRRAADQRGEGRARPPARRDTLA